jgi:hypothetical protein
VWRGSTSQRPSSMGIQTSTIRMVVIFLRIPGDGDQRSEVMAISIPK